MSQIETTPAFIENVYQTMRQNLDVIRQRLNRPLTLTEKILYGHLANPKQADLTRGTAYIETNPDRVALQDATAQMAILQFMQAQKSEAAVPVTIHCDHLIRAYVGAKADLETANFENNEVYNFLSSAGQKYGFGFWKPGSGIIHQVVLEQYAFPGLMMLGTDSHTPNAGGLGSLACGVGGADAVDVMVGMPWEVLHPEVVGVRLSGQLRGWAAPKDIILKLCDILTVKGGTNRIIEYFGSGVASLSATGRATICNMGAEIGATTSIFPYDQRVDTYLQATHRADYIPVIHKNTDLLAADAGVLEQPDAYYDLIIDIDLDTLEPGLVGPHSPDLYAPASQMAEHIKGPKTLELNNNEPAPANLSAALIGSCTNSSYEDMGRIADMAVQLDKRGVKLKNKLLVTPGSEQVRATIERDGQMDALKNLGAMVLANACGPCIGQWQRDDIKKGTVNSIISSYNRNFPKRNDGNANTCSFIGSPETVLAYAVFGRLDVDPFNTPIAGADGQTFTLNEIVPDDIAEVPDTGFETDEHGYVAPTLAGKQTEVKVNPDSERLQILNPFPAWDGEDYAELPLLMKVTGKCTTDHISPAGPWLKYRGHLDNISDNMLSGGVNAFTRDVGKTRNRFTNEMQNTSDVARDYKGRGLGWVIVGDENYGEGSSREHAAMSPRLLGGLVVMVRSFARIHQTNLKKQGVLPFTFVNPADYDLIEETDSFSFHDLDQLVPGQHVQCTIHHQDGSTATIELAHTLNHDQIEWFKAGSALNALKR